LCNKHSFFPFFFLKILHRNFKLLVEKCRYLAEFKTGAERKEAAENTMNAYKAAQVDYMLKLPSVFNLPGITFVSFTS
jgi:hypothetical protein